MLTSGASLLKQEKDSALLKLSKDGAGIVLPWDVMKNERYFMFEIETLEEHCDAFNVYVYGKDDEPTMTIRLAFFRRLQHRFVWIRSGLKQVCCFQRHFRGSLRLSAMVDELCQKKLHVLR